MNKPMTPPTSQAALAVIALLIMGGIALAMTFHEVPVKNHDYLLILLGALAGALTIQGNNKIADKLTTSTGPDANIQADAPDPQNPALETKK